MNYYKIAKVFDATFEKANGKLHYHKRRNEKSIPKDMKKRQYEKIAEKVSLKNIDGKSVRAFKVRKKGKDRIVKCDGKWLVVYVDGKHGTIVSAYPCPMSKWVTKMKNSNGEEIFKEN